MAWRLALPLLLFYSPILVCSSSQEVQDNDPSKLFKSASEMMSLRKYDGALGLLNAVLELDPNHSEAYRQRATVLRHRCRHKEAESDYNKFLELKPGTASVEKELAQLLQAQNALESAYTQSDAGEFSKVLEYVNKIVLVFSPGCLKAKLLKAKALLALKDYSNVISETGFILKEDEDNLDALLLRGRAYYYLADHDVANRHYQKGLRLDPEHSELKKAYFGLKKLLKKTKSAEDNAAKSKFRVAVEDYKAALAMDPDHTLYNVQLHLGLCKTLVKLGRGKEAINTCTEALSIDEELVEALSQELPAGTDTRHTLWSDSDFSLDTDSGHGNPRGAHESGKAAQAEQKERLVQDPGHLQDSIGRGHQARVQEAGAAVAPGQERGEPRGGGEHVPRDRVRIRGA
ncbi:unnamed protein product [Triticum turgidum subsp. durum]|uniref:Peptidylprolyl isomerase n=1 Tax=Triticum turgidum subsp. durum TaxID=4567 RepID=A0A9R1R0A0_TRITD|nr:unnamed protein product [Triticum turgidum subsp. durum]